MLATWVSGHFAGLFVFNYWLREFPLSAVANLFEFRCQQKQLMQLSYKICLCSLHAFRTGNNLILSVLYDIDLNKTFKNKINRTLSRVVLKHDVSS